MPGHSGLIVGHGGFRSTTCGPRMGTVGSSLPERGGKTRRNSLGAPQTDSVLAMDKHPHIEPDGDEGTVGFRAAESLDARAGLHRDVVAALPVATVVLDSAGLVIEANKAFADLLHLTPDACIGEPFLLWLARASQREGFGRAFRALRERDGGRGFTLEVGLLPRLGPRVDILVRSASLPGGCVVVTCHPSSPTRMGPEAELGVAVTRSLDALDQGVLLVDTDGRVVHANPSATTLLGEGIVGRSVLELASRADVPALSRALTVARTGSWQGEMTLRRRDGETVPTELSLAAGTGPAVMLIRDLSERRRRAFEERLVAQVDRCLVQADDPLQSVSAACAALGAALEADRVCVLARTADGWQRWGLIGEQPQPAVELGVDEGPPESWEQGRDVVLGSPDEDTAGAFGVRVGLSHVARVPLRGPSGVVGHLLLGRKDGASWDERDRTLLGTVAAQIALGLASGLLTIETRELAAYQSMLLNQTTVLLGSVDAAGRVVTWNRASEALLGTPSAEAEGRRFGIEVGVAQVPDQWADFWDTVLRDGDVAREITLRHRGGDEIPLHLEGRRLDAGGETAGAVFVGLDLRDRRALETQILRSQKLAAVGLLAAGIAHEINNPLSGVVGYSKLLLEQRTLPEGVRRKVEKIAQSGERCRKIVEGVLLFSRQREGGQRAPIDLGSLIDRVVGIGEYQWKMHNVRIMRERNDAAVVHADPDQLEQVALNLLSNAVDAMPRGGTVRINLAREGDEVRLSVADEGHGIPAEVLPRIFDPFFSTKEIGKGTGLGLAISYGIVQDHGGDIVVESDGRGARFTVILPARPAVASSPTDLPS